MGTAPIASMGTERGKVKVLDKGSVELINFMGGDKAVVAAARVSNGKLYADASKGPDLDKKLIRFLMRNHHTSPFEHSIFTFYVKCPLFVAREWHRHRTFSYNEVSGRYTEFTDDYYIPTVLRTQHPTNKQASVPFADITDEEAAKLELMLRVNSDRCYGIYRNLLTAGMAREMARMVLPLNFYTQFYATVDAHNLMHFLRLRTSEGAQLEIREYANALKAFLSKKMPLTYEAYEEFNA